MDAALVKNAIHSYKLNAKLRRDNYMCDFRSGFVILIYVLNSQEPRRQTGANLNQIISSCGDCPQVIAYANNNCRTKSHVSKSTFIHQVIQQTLKVTAVVLVVNFEL